MFGQVELRSSSQGSRTVATLSECRNGTQATYGFINLGGTSSYERGVLSPGDLVTATIEKVNTTWKLTLKNVTRRWSVSKTSTYIRLTEYFIGVASANAPLAKFPPFAFSSAAVNGAPLGGDSPNTISMVTNNVLRATPTPIQNGTIFQVTWKRK